MGAEACVGHGPCGFSSYLSLEPEYKTVKQIAAQEIPRLTCLVCKLGGELKLYVVLEAKLRSQLNGLNKEDTKLRDFFCTKLGESVPSSD